MKDTIYTFQNFKTGEFKEIARSSVPDSNVLNIPWEEEMDLDWRCVSWEEVDV